MCGIFGAININISSKIPAVLKSLNRRGPDSHGLYQDDNFCTTLIHTRLSIIDTSNVSSQPMHYNNFVITFNGEIYNYKELKEELSLLGYNFKTKSDTEVLLAAYLEWEEKCLIRLRGMFAFGIWDKKNKTLFAARDYFGIKPLYYYRNGDGIIFSSLIKTLLESDIPNKKVNLKGVTIFLQTGSFTNNQTIIQDITQLPPAHYLKFKAGNLTIERYWNIVEESVTFNKPLNYGQALKDVRLKLEEAAHYHLVADVPIGVFLSGGIDSCVSTGLMSQLSSSRLKTFTIGFEKKFKEFNEIDQAKLISKRFNTEHHEIIINNSLINDSVNNFIAAIDQPSVDGFNTFLVSSETSKQTKVCVSGLGADEIFGGYPHFLYASIAKNEYLNYLKYAPFLSKILKQFPLKYRELFLYITSSPSDRHRMIRNYESLLPVAHKLKHIDEGNFKSIINEYYEVNITPDLDAVQQLSLWEIEQYLSNTLLRDADALSMSCGLELRPLFLDHKLASYVFGLKAEYKMKGFRKKRILLDSCKDILIPEVYKRKKQGFELPLTYWLKTNLKSEFLNLLSGEEALDLFTKEYIEYIKLSIKNDNLQKTHWAVYVLLKFIKFHALETS